jgi:hypothetical protein
MSEQLNDEMLAGLDRLGFTTGALPDRLSAWLASEGATPDTQIMDQWSEFFDVELIPAGQHNDRMQKWLLSEGITIGDLNQMQLDYWSAVV